MTHTGDKEIRSISRRLLDSLKGLAYMQCTLGRIKVRLGAGGGGGSVRSPWHTLK